MAEKDFTFDDVYVSLTDRYESTQGTSSTVDDMMKKSIFQPGFGALKMLPRVDDNKNKKTGKGYELPEEEAQDLKIIQMRSALDSKRFYKRNVFRGMKDVQVGTVIDSPADFYRSRLPKKLRKPTLVDQLLADAQFKNDIKRRYTKIIEENPIKFKKQFKYKRGNKSKNKNKEQKKRK